MTAVDDVTTETAKAHSEPGLAWWTDRPVVYQGGLCAAQNAPLAGGVIVQDSLVPESDVVPLPKVGERVPQGVHPSAWLLAVTVLAYMPDPTLHLTYATTTGQVLTHTTPISHVEQVRATPSPGSTDDARDVALALRALHESTQRWRDDATRIAHEYADDNDLCERFDAAMREIGLEARRDEVTLQLQITASPSIVVDLERDEDPHEWLSERDEEEVRTLLLQSLGYDCQDQAACRLYDALVDHIEVNDYWR